jgi:hypothetical protein
MKKKRENKVTVLMQAVNNNDIDRVQKLIHQGINVNELDANQDAPLVMAAYKGYTEIVKLLLEAGADTAVLDPELAEVYIGLGVKFPPMENPPPGYVTRIRVDRIEGVGPWTVAWQPFI